MFIYMYKTKVVVDSARKQYTEEIAYKLSYVPSNHILLKWF